MLLNHFVDALSHSECMFFIMNQIIFRDFIISDPRKKKRNWKYGITDDEVMESITGIIGIHHNYGKTLS